MALARGHIQSLTDAVRSLGCGVGCVGRVGYAGNVVRVGNGELAAQNEMGGEPGMRVWPIVGVSRASVSVTDEAE